MQYLDNDYSVPVICCHGKSIAKALFAVSSLYSGRPHIFARHISPIKRLCGICHRLTSDDEKIILLTLLDFADSYSEVYTHVYVAYDAYTLDFYKKYVDRLESRYVLANTVQI